MPAKPFISLNFVLSILSFSTPCLVVGLVLLPDTYLAEFRAMTIVSFLSPQFPFVVFEKIIIK